MASSSKATLILLIYGILMHYSVFCTPMGLSYPKIRLDNDVFDEDGTLGFDSEPLAVRSAPPYPGFFPPERSEDNSMEEESEPLSKRHSDGIFTDSYSRYRKQMAVQKYLAAVLGRRYRQRVRNKGRRLAYL